MPSVELSRVSCHLSGGCATSKDACHGEERPGRSPRPVPPSMPGDVAYGCSVCFPSTLKYVEVKCIASHSVLSPRRRALIGTAGTVQGPTSSIGRDHYSGVSKALRTHYFFLYVQIPSNSPIGRRRIQRRLSDGEHCDCCAFRDQALIGKRRRGMEHIRLKLHTNRRDRSPAWQKRRYSGWGDKPGAWLRHAPDLHVHHEAGWG